MPLLYPQQKKLPLFNDYLVEVPSGYFEIMFIDYLIKNKINIDEARLLLNERIAMIGDTHETLDAILSKTDVDVDTNGFFFVKDEFGTFKVDGRSDLIYGFGYLFALNMMVLGRDNPKKFIKTFSNFITSRAESSLDEIIEIMGISVDEFTDSEIIRPRIKEETYQLKKRYNMI